MVGSAVGIGFVVAAVAGLVPLRHDLSRATPALVLVVPVVLAAPLGGGGAALVVAVVAATAFNLAFIPPYWTLKVDVVDDAVALAVFLAVALVLGWLVSLESERRSAAERAAGELQVLWAQFQEVMAEGERLAAEANRLRVLEQVDEQRSGLLRAVSHDLRTPLSTIRAVATDLLDGVDYDAETQRELLEAVAGEAERLDRLVANLLSMSRIEAGALRPDRQAVDLGELVTLGARRWRSFFRDARLEVDAPGDLPLVDGDHTQLDLVLSNLLENAARHSPPGSTARLRIRARNGAIEVRVSDDGQGIAHFEQERIFQPFFRGDGSRSSGLGLAICKAIVEAHDGRLTVESSPGHGASFVVTLPARRV
jgi:two-component system sensor histidine kinase KdpD